MSDELSFDLTRPSWLRNALANPKRIWNSWPVLLERDKQREAFRAQSRELATTPGQNAPQEDPFSVWSATVLDESMKKHRYGIMAHDRNRVVINGDPQRYVNASYVREGAGGRWWVVAEAPMTFATHAFLSLFLPSDDVYLRPPRIHTVIQLCPAGEGSSHPPAEYYPSSLSQSWTIHPERGPGTEDLPPLVVRTVKQKRIAKASCTKTTFLISRPSRRQLDSLTRGDGTTRHPPHHHALINGEAGTEEQYESFEVVHLLFEAWPAKSVPNSDGQKALRELMKVAYSTNTRPQYRHQAEDAYGTLGSNAGYEDEVSNEPITVDPPILVHCAEGGRTGTFIAINSLLRSYKCLPSPYDETHFAPKPPTSPLGPSPSEIALDPVLREFDNLLDQRAHMVDNENQVRFVYQMLSDGIAERDYHQNALFTPLPSPAPSLDAFSKKYDSKRSRRPKLSLENVWSLLRGR